MIFLRKCLRPHPRGVCPEIHQVHKEQHPYKCRKCLTTRMLYVCMGGRLLQ